MLLDPLSLFLGGSGALLGRKVVRSAGERRRRSRSLADLLPWKFLVGPSTVLLQDGALLTGFGYRGPDLESASPSELNALAEHLNASLLPWTDGWMFHVDLRRVPIADYLPPGDFPDSATAAVDLERRLTFERSARHFVSRTYLLVTFRPPREVYSRAAALFVEGGVRRAAPDAAWRETLARFEADVTQLERSLSLHLRIRRLDSDELLSHLHACLTGDDHAVVTPPDGAFLDAFLADRELVGGWAPRIGPRHLRVVAVHGLPHASHPGILDFLGSLGIPFRASHRLIPLSTRSATAQITAIRRVWFNARKGAQIFLPASRSEKDEELFVNQAARSMAADAADALAEANSNAVRFALYTLSLVVTDPEEERVEELAGDLVKALHDRRFPARVETLNALEAFLGTLPGIGYRNIRRTLVSTRNLADLIPATSIWPGDPVHPSPLYPSGSPALFLAAAEGSTPFYGNLFAGDVGHSLVVGRTGGGKSTFVNFVISSFFRYPGAQVFSFDVGHSGWLLAQAAEGCHYDFGVETIRLQPLRAIDAAAERVWALEWLESLLALQRLEVQPMHREALHQALVLLAGDAPEHRTLSTLLDLLQDGELRLALAPYAAGGALGDLLDASTDDLEDHPYQVFELRRLMEQQDRALLPVLTLLFHRIEERLQEGRPTLIVIEEAWMALLHPAFAAKLNGWLRTLRKANAAVMLVTQSLAQLWESPHRHVLLESCPTRFLLPNPDAAAAGFVELYREGLGLNETEIDLLARAVPKRDYYVTSTSGSRLFRLQLGPVARAFLATPEGMTPALLRTTVSQLIAQHGPGCWQLPWLRHLGLAEAADVVAPLFERSSS